MLFRPRVEMIQINSEKFDVVKVGLRKNYEKGKKLLERRIKKPTEKNITT